MAEDWLYQKALDIISREHNLNLIKLYDHSDRIGLNAEEFSSSHIQIDIIAADTENRILVIGEAKEFLSFQGVSECAEQLILKHFLLKKYYRSDFLGKENENFTRILIDDVKNYLVFSYVILGSYSGKNYNNAKCNDEHCLKRRLDEYSLYLASIHRCDIGIVLFLSHQSDIYVIKRATGKEYEG